MLKDKYDKIIALIDNANAEDPNIESVNGKEYPKELLYSKRMSDMLFRFKPDADNEIKIAIHAQHIQRWKVPRNTYPMDRKGYHQWRTGLYAFHADTVARIMTETGCEEKSIERVNKAIGKKSRKENEDTQLLEDVAGLVFIEYYMLAFAEKHPEYSEEKWIDIIRKTWDKMSDTAHKFALDGNLKLPQSLIPLIKKSIF